MNTGDPIRITTARRVAAATKLYDGTIQSGIIIGEPNDVYHASGCIGSTMIRDFMKSPKLYESKYVTKQFEEKETEAMQMGTEFETFLLEPGRWEREYAVQPEIPDDVPRNKDGGPSVRSKEWKSHEENTLNPWIVANANKKHVERSRFAKYCAMATGIRNHPEACRLLSGGMPQVVVRTPVLSLGKNNIRIQCRFDWLNFETEDPYAVDLKTTDDLEGWDWQFSDLGYIYQDAFYRGVLQEALGTEGIKKFLFIVSEKKPPHECDVREADKLEMHIAYLDIIDALTSLSHCLHSGVFPPKYNSIRPVNLSFGHPISKKMRERLKS